MQFHPATRRVAVGLAAAALALTATEAAASAAAQRSIGTGVAAAAITCSTSSSGKPATFYSGPSASYVYDARFSGAAAVPSLSTHTPQGVTSWTNWDGQGHDLLLVTAYRAGGHAWVYGIDASSGGYVNTVEIAETHAGGIAVSGSWIFISGAGQSIRKYRTSDMRAAMNDSRAHLYVASVGTPRAVHGASFITAYNGYLYAGLFNDSGRDRMYAYRVNSDGSLTTQAGGYEIPTKTQGVVVTANRYIFSTSYGRTNRGNIYVVKRGYTSLDNATLSCFRSPSMNEGITNYGGNVYVVFESGSYEYRADALNPITRLHKATLSSLTGLV